MHGTLLMKHARALLLLFTATLLQAELPPLPGSSRTITRPSEVIEWAPKDIMPKKGVAWTTPQMVEVSAAMMKKLAERPTVLKMRVEVADIYPNGDDLAVYSSLPNNEGYRIRLLSHFPKEEWKDRLVKIQKGDKVTIAAPVNILRYHILWNEFGLTIGTKGGSIEK